MSSGILGPLTGKAGLYYVRRTHSGDLILVPRYRTDAKTPAQIEYRRRLSILAKAASKIYLNVLKPYSVFYRDRSVIVAEFCEINMDSGFPFYTPFWPHLWRNLQPEVRLVMLRRDAWTGQLQFLIPPFLDVDVQLNDDINIVVWHPLSFVPFYYRVLYTGGIMRIDVNQPFPSGMDVFYDSFLVRALPGGGLREVKYYYRSFDYL